MLLLRSILMLLWLLVLHMRLRALWLLVLSGRLLLRWCGVKITVVSTTRWCRRDIVLLRSRRMAKLAGVIALYRCAARCRLAARVWCKAWI